MTKQPAKHAPVSNGKTTPPPQPVNLVDGVPDAAVCDTKTSRRRLVLVLLLFAGWAAFLMYCLLAGRV
jgi:hypothetical protein